MDGQKTVTKNTVTENTVTSNVTPPEPPVTSNVTPPEPSVASNVTPPEPSVTSNVTPQKTSEQNSKNKRIWIAVLIGCCGAIVILVIVLILCIVIGSSALGGSSLSLTDMAKDAMNDLIYGQEGTVTTISDAKLLAILESSDLSTAEFEYNGIVEECGEDQKSVKYYVSYKGTVMAGIDFEDITITVDDDSKVITVKLPETKIQDATVDIGSLDYIFIDNSYQTDTVSKDAYELCQDDLKKEANQSQELLETAKNNAKAVVEGLIKPWVMQVDDSYTVVIE